MWYSPNRKQRRRPGKIYPRRRWFLSCFPLYRKKQWCWEVPAHQGWEKAQTFFCPQSLRSHRVLTPLPILVFPRIWSCSEVDLDKCLRTHSPPISGKQRSLPYWAMQWEVKGTPWLPPWTGLALLHFTAETEPVPIAHSKLKFPQLNDQLF